MDFLVGLCVGGAVTLCACAGVVFIYCDRLQAFLTTPSASVHIFTRHDGGQTAVIDLEALP